MLEVENFHTFGQSKARLSLSVTRRETTWSIYVYQLKRSFGMPIRTLNVTA